MFYRILTDSDNKSKVLVSSSFYNKHITDNKEMLTICIGARTIDAKIVVLPYLNEDEIKLSYDIINYLCIPSNIMYQIKLDNETMCIGPVIGILITKNKKKLTKKNLSNLAPYTIQYKAFRGLLCAFYYEGVDFDKGLVEGYYYKPGLKKTWQKGILPLPSVIYTRAYLSSEELHKLKRFTKNKIFNSYNLDKWDFWNIASKHEILRNHIPHTRLISSMDDIDNVLMVYGEAYLKPINRTLARGLMKVSRIYNSYYFYTNDDVYPVQINKREIAIKYVNRIQQRRQYLVQQPIRLLKFDNRYIDFRVIMQKDETKHWSCSAIIARFGKQGGICSNFIEEGYALTFEEALSKLYSDEHLVRYKKHEVIEICKMFCEVLDKTDENYGDLGIDVAIDENLKIWIIEINKRHLHNLALYLNDISFYHMLKTNIIKYAVAQSGFEI